MPENYEGKIKHVAIILDGNRRWAKERGLHPTLGHKKGLENLKPIINKAKDLGIRCLTLWAFSTENWKRSKEEIKFLFELMKEAIDRIEKDIDGENVRFVHIGRKDRIPKILAKRIIDLENKTRNNNTYTICTAIDYGGHDELIRVISKLQKDNISVNEENIEKYLDTAELPKIDLIIRTGGEKRLSGFLSWQCAYSELYFTDKYFPDFSPEDLEIAINDYMTRERRFGGDPSNNNKR